MAVDLDVDVDVDVDVSSDVDLDVDVDVHVCAQVWPKMERACAEYKRDGQIFLSFPQTTHFPFIPA